MGKEYLDKAELYETISELEDLARQRVLDTPSNSPAYPRYLAQLQERTNLKHKIYDMPAADVAPVVHGKWIRKVENDGYAMSLCSACNFPVHIYLGESKFCPSCGAKMDKED